MSKNKQNFIVKSDKFGDFLDKIGDITKISDTIRLKIDKDDTLMYGTIGETSILAFKNYIVKTNQYFDFKDFDFTLDYVILDAKKFTKKLNLLNGEAIMDLTYKDHPDNDDIKIVRSLTIKDKKLTLSNVGGEPYKIRDINKTMLSSKLKASNASWSFNVPVEDFNSIKKLSSIDSDDKTINITVNNDGLVSFGENAKWSLDVSNTEVENESLVFGKKYLSCINIGNNDDVSFNVFETFILIKNIDTDSESNLMLSFEQSYDDE